RSARTPPGWKALLQLARRRPRGLRKRPRRRTNEQINVEKWKLEVRNFMKQKLAILGAGPIGLEAALAAHSRGYDVKIFERGEIADSIRQWGHIRMFSPFEMNVSVEGIALLRAGGVELPNGEEQLTGAEFADRYPAPLAAHLGAPIQLHTGVMASARDTTRKNERIGD